MKGPLSKLRRRKADDDAAPPPEPGSEQPTEIAATADPSLFAEPVNVAVVTEGQPTEVLQPTQQPAALPAGVEIETERRVGFRDRGRYRRRLRYLRRVRELGFRDLGGLVFDLHRFGREGQELVRSKLQALEQVDGELRALERALDERRDILELREPGIAACQRCGALHGSDARFCPSCGVPFSGPRAIAEVGEGGVQTVGQIGAVAPAVEPAPATRPEPAGPAPEDTVLIPPQEAEAPAQPEPASEEPPAPAPDQPTTEQPALVLPDEPAEPASDPHAWLPTGVQPPASGEEPDAGADEPVAEEPAADAANADGDEPRDREP